MLIEALKNEIQKNLQLALTAAQNTYDIATHEDSKAENKYDTRGLEASYLAGAQAERVMDLKDTLNSISGTALKEFKTTDKIAIGALIHLISSEKNLWVILLNRGGGQNVKFENQQVQVITPESPLGRLLIGKELNDSFQLNGKEYEIIELI